MLFLQDGLYLKVDLHNISNFTRGAWKRSIKLFGKVSCRHVGCSIESKTFEDTLEHYLNCPMAQKKVNITSISSSHIQNLLDSLHFLAFNPHFLHIKCTYFTWLYPCCRIFLKQA
jgi:hypothetical protein